MKNIFRGVIAENHAGLGVENLKGVPVMTRVGSEDTSVSPLFTRRYTRLLRELGDVIFDTGAQEQRKNARGVHVGNVSFSEVKGEGHWWWDTGGVLYTLVYDLKY
jgi:hypothetical protein